jgi:hypothetical protein
MSLLALMALLYAIQAACSNPGLAYLPVATYLTHTLSFSAAQLASFQAIILLPWFTKPLWGLLADGVAGWNISPRNYLLICYGGIVLCFGVLSLWATPAFAGLLGLILVISTAVAFTDVLADRLMVVEGKRQGRTNLLQAAQWAGLGFTAIAMFLCGGWLADHASLATAFGLSMMLPAMGGLVVAYQLPQSADGAARLRQSWSTFWQALHQPSVRSVLGIVLLLSLSPTPVDYWYQTQVLQFDNALVGHLKATEFLGMGVGALTFGLLARQWQGLPLLTCAVLGRATAILALALLQDVSLAYGVYLVRGFMETVGLLGLFGLVVPACPQGAEGFTYALMVSGANLAASLGLIVGGQLYDWGLPFAAVATVGAGYTLICGMAIARRRFPF